MQTEKRLQRRLERCARELESIRLEAESEGIAHGATWRMSYMGDLSLLSFQADANRPTPTAISANILTAFVSDIY